MHAKCRRDRRHRLFCCHRHRRSRKRIRRLENERRKWLKEPFIWNDVENQHIHYAGNRQGETRIILFRSCSWKHQIAADINLEYTHESHIRHICFAWIKWMIVRGAPMLVSTNIFRTFESKGIVQRLNGYSIFCWLILLWTRTKC